MLHIERVADAWEFVSVKHAGQTYGGRLPNQQIPYISHLASVAFEILSVYEASDIGEEQFDLVLKCALLHDVLEDTDTSEEELTGLFGAQVAAAVSALTKNMAITDNRLRMADSIARIKIQPHTIWSVKLADRITNLYHPPFYWTKERIDQYKEESLFILKELGAANVKLAARLEQKIAEYGLN